MSAKKSTRGTNATTATPEVTGTSVQRESEVSKNKTERNSPEDYSSSSCSMRLRCTGLAHCRSSGTW